MPKRSPKPSRRKPANPSPSRRPLVWLALLLATIAILLFARSGYSLWARHTAVKRLQCGSIADACRYLRRAASSSPDDAQIDMMLAFCYRQLQKNEDWKAALETAKSKGASQEDLEREAQLHRIQSGNWVEGTESQLAVLAGEGITSYDVPLAFVAGCLANGRNVLAQQILDVWCEDSPDSPHLAYMRGKYAQAQGDVEQARKCYEDALDVEPRHELARIALAESYDENNQLELALRQYAELAAVSPASEAAALGAARCLRKMGQLDRAHAILEPFSRGDDPTSAVAEEMGCIATERGHLQTAERCFELAGVDRTRNPLFLMNAVRLQGIQGKAVEAEQYFLRLAALGDRITRARELQTKLTLNPEDTATAAEINRLYNGLDAEMKALEAVPIGSLPKDVQSSPGRRLFTIHCSACHGSDGRGDGRAGRHLFPRPRDLRWEPSRLVSTQNGAPTLDDTIAMLQRGIPGASMPSYANLSEEELRLLAEEVHRMRREGLPEQFAHTLKLQGEEVTEEDMEEVEEIAAELASPGELVEIPPLDTLTADSLQRGKEAYAKLGCVTCHGEDGIGGEDQMWHDEQGFPVRPRDLTREPFKGSRDPRSVYQRLAIGMPGTVHPSCTEVSPEELADVVQFCLSLAKTPESDLTDHQRATLDTVRSYRAALNAK